MGDLNISSPWTPTLVQSEVAAYVEKNATIKQFKKGEIIYHQGFLANYLYLLLDGRVEVNVINDHGRKNILAIHEPICFLGEMALNTLHYQTTAICLSNARFAVLPFTNFWDLSKHKPEIYMSLLKGTTVKLQSHAWLISQQAKPVEERVISLLCKLADTFGSKCNLGIRLDLPLTHQMIADIVGSSRVRVSQAITKLTRQKRIIKYKKGMIITNL